MKYFSRHRSTWLAILASAASVALWFSIPSERWGGRLWAVGSSVCHQIPSHSITIAGLQFPICARCAGLYLGSLIGLLNFATRGKNNGLPKRHFLYLLFVLLMAWAGDGINSFISDLINQPLLYETSNLSRLATGFGMGLVMSVALTTLFNIVIWQNAEHQPVLQSGWQLLVYAGFSFVAGSALWFASLPVFRFLSTLSILTILGVISMLYTVFWVIVLKKENLFTSWQMLSPYLIAGFATALAQVWLLNFIRLRFLG